MPRAPDRKLSLAELEWALKAAAYVVLRHGDAYVPMMERLEQELEAARREPSGSDRARRILATLGRPALVATQPA